MSIEFDVQQKLFVLSSQRSFYALRVLESGEVVHVGHGPVPAGMSAKGLLGSLNAYPESTIIWDAQARQYEYPTFCDITYHEVALKAAFPKLAKPLAAGEAEILPVRDVRLRYESHEIRTDAKPGLAAAHGHPSRSNKVRQTLCVHLKDSVYDLRVTLCYRLTEEHDIIERWVEVTNRTGMDLPIEHLDFATMHLPNGRYELLRTAGTWAREFVPVRQKLEQGITVLDQRGLNTGHFFTPAFMLYQQSTATEDGGDVYFGALAFSGNWSIRFECLASSACRVHGGYEPSDFGMTLKNGETHVTPAFIMGVSGEGIGGASRRLHRYARDYVLPWYGKADTRPVLYNAWEAAYFDIRLDHQIELARKAASIGVELFCVDDGWFGARRDDRAGLGDWVVSRDLFPNGLKPLIDEVQRLGMKFGLWVEPEMVNPDSDLYRAHPDWVLHFPQRPRTEQRQQLILDLGRKEVVEYIFGVLDKLLQENQIGFFKWDMNRYVTEPGSVAGKAIWRKHVEGLYSIWDRLRAKYPKLWIQSCSGGGGRIDYGILQRADQAWTSDNTDAHDRVYVQEGYSYFYPARAMESWVTHEHNHQTGRQASLDLRFDVAMRGALGIGSSLDRMTQEELDSCSRKIAFYKKIRHIVQDGELYRLTDAMVEGYSVWQFVLPDGSAAVYSLAIVEHLYGYMHAPAKLKGLTPDATYRISDESGKELHRMSGMQLMALGLPDGMTMGGIGKAITSRTLHLQRV